MKSAWIFAPAFAALSFSASGQTGATPAQYSFSISDSQIWTDTGVDLAAGDSLSITAETKTLSDTNCSPAGFKVIAGNPGAIPLPASPPGALIAKTAEKADPVLVGNKGELKVDARGPSFSRSQPECDIELRICGESADHPHSGCGVIR
jgi:hypothetical protein